MNTLPSKTRRTTRAQRGITLVETSVVASLLAVLTGIVAPSFKSSIERRHLEGAAAQLRTDIHLARMLAVARNAPMRISFDTTPAGASCYVVHSGTANQCSCAADGSALCQPGAFAERAVRFDAGGAVDVRANSRSLLFDPMKGTVTPTATVQLHSRSGAAIHEIVNVMGRVRACSPAPALAGYKAC
jgi:type IV fimbrial biogenesis protein FimT